MTFISLPDCVKIEIKCRKNGAPVINVIWAKVNVTIDLATLATIAGVVKDWWIANIKLQTTSSMSLEEVVVTDWSVANSIQHVETVSPPSPGTGGTDDTPSNVAAVVTFYTGYTGRSNRGRVYMGGLDVTDTTGNTLGTAYVVAMITAWADLATLLDAEGVQHVVASFYTNNAPRVVGAYKVITDYGMNNVVDTQRRRIPRVDN